MAARSGGIDPDEREDSWSATVWVNAQMNLSMSCLASPIGDQHASFAGRRRVIHRPLAFCGVRLIRLLHGQQLLCHVWHFHAVGLLDRHWLGWNLRQGRPGVIASFRDVWRIALDGRVRRVWQLCLGQPRTSNYLVTMLGSSTCPASNIISFRLGDESASKLNSRTRGGVSRSLVGWHWARR